MLKGKIKKKIQETNLNLTGLTHKLRDNKYKIEIILYTKNMEKMTV